MRLDIHSTHMWVLDVLCSCVGLQQLGGLSDSFVLRALESGWRRLGARV